MKPSEVPAGPVAVDTDVFSFIHTRRDRHADYSALITGHPLALAFPVVGELRAGYLNAKWGTQRIKDIETAMRACVVIPSDNAVVDQWAELHVRFKNRLKGGGVNDMWIAACCLVHGLPLATGNITDFATIAVEFPLTIVHPDA